MSDDRLALRVVDDFPLDISIGAAELDALEAFLMPLVNAILSGDLTSFQAGGPDPAPAVPTDSQASQKAG